MKTENKSIKFNEGIIKELVSIILIVNVKKKKKKVLKLTKVLQESYFL